LKSPRSVWTIIREDTELVLPIFRLLKRRMRRPTDAKEGDFYIAQAPLWVNIVALTPEREVILVEQYRHRIQAVIAKLDAGEHHTRTLLGIALDCGFNSKSTFNRAFKRFAGMSPMTYVKSLG